MPARKDMQMYRTTALIAAAAMALASAAAAGDISTHVLNTTTGTGGAGIPVTLEMQSGGAWTEIAAAETGENGRVNAFGIETQDALYRLNYDVSGYEALGDTPFFPEISITFHIQDTAREHHIPILINPFGYSTYLGN
jgi:5-hydroxyisourate hydrolase